MSAPWVRALNINPRSYEATPLKTFKGPPQRVLRFGPNPLGSRTARCVMQDRWRLLHYGSSLSSAALETLFEDTIWWIVLLATWANGGSSSLDYDLLSASELMNSPGRMYVGRLDSSGLNGFGYFHEDLHSVISSLTGELNPLLHFLERTSITSRALVWMMDSAAAFFAIDRGRQSLSSAALESLFEDTIWWIIVLLATWANGESSSVDYDISSASELIDSPERLHVGQSHSSGLDGFGYFHGDLHSVDSRAHGVSVRWPYGYPPESSLTGDLNQLLHFLERTPITSCVLVWVMDSAAAVFAIDRGKVSTQRDFDLLSKAYALAYVKRIQLLVLWVPREWISTADTLSHLSHLLNRSTTEGVFGTD